MNFFKRNIFSILVIIFVFLFASCNFNHGVAENNTVVVSGSCSVSGAIPWVIMGDFNSLEAERTASYTRPNSVSYVINAKTEPGSVAQKSVDVIAKSDGTYSLTLEYGKYNITARGYDTSEIEDVNIKSLSLLEPILEGAIAETVEVNSSSVQSLSTIILEPTKKGTGSAKLIFTVDSSINYASIVCSGVSSAYSNTYTFDFSAGKTKTLQIDSLASGSYSLKCSFYKSVDGSGNPAFICNESMNIVDNMETNAWLNKNSDYISSGGFNLSSSCLEKFKTSTFYVGGTGSSDSNTGSYFDAFATLDKAIEEIKTIDDGSTTYNIFLLGNILPSSNVTVSGIGKLNISSYGTSNYFIGKSVKVGAVDEITFSNVDLAGTSTAISGAAIVLDGTDAVINLTGCHFNGGGAAISCQSGNGKQINISDCEFINCSTSGKGAAIHVKGVPVIVEDTIFKNCGTTGSYGGAIYLEESSTPKSSLSNVDFINCYSGTGGANIYLSGNGATVVLKDKVTFTVDSTAAGYSGSKNYKNDITLQKDSTGYSYLTMGSSVSGIDSSHKINISLLDVNPYLYSAGDMVVCQENPAESVTSAWFDVISPEGSWSITANGSGTGVLSKIVAFYVSNSASDSNSGTRTAPFKTVQKAVDYIIEKNAAEKLINPSDDTAYSIILLSNITASDTSIFTASTSSAGTDIGNSFVDITPSSSVLLNLTIKSDEGHNYIIDANRTSSSTSLSRVMYVSPTVSLSLKDLNIQGGYLPSTQDGGGIYIDSALVDMNTCEINGNTARYGGAIYINSNLTSAKLEMTDCVIGDKTITDTSTNLKFGNYASNSAGGLCVDATDSTQKTEVTLNNSEIVGNYSNSTGGGVNVVNSHTSFKMNGGCVSNNGAAQNGGGLNIYANKSNNTCLKNVLISDNKAYGVSSGSGNGGGIQTPSGSIFFVDGCTITGNGAKNLGGGIYASGSVNILTSDEPLVIKENYTGASFDVEENFTLNKTARIFIAGTLNNESEIYVTCLAETYPYVFTSDFGYGTTNTNLPSVIFKADNFDSYKIDKNASGEAVMAYAGAAGGAIDVGGLGSLSFTIDKTTVSGSIAEVITVTANKMCTSWTAVLKTNTNITVPDTTDYYLFVSGGNTGMITFKPGTCPPGKYYLTINAVYDHLEYTDTFEITLTE